MLKSKNVDTMDFQLSKIIEYDENFILETGICVFHENPANLICLDMKLMI
jgi:hypothetical protein